MGSGGTARQIGLSLGATDQRAIRVSPDGKSMVVLDTRAGGDHLFVVTAPAVAPTQLAMPPRALGSGPWHAVAATWTGPENFAVLLTGTGAGSSGVIGSYPLAGASRNVPIWTPLHGGAGPILSLSPDALQVARLETLPASGAFAGQEVVRLEQVSGNATGVRSLVA
jgi:hypothetical protein